MSQEITLNFVSALPDITEAHRGMESKENGQRHSDVSDDSPSPEAVKVHLNWIRISAARFQRIDCPHGKIAHQKKRHHFTAWFAANLKRKE